MPAAAGPEPACTPAPARLHLHGLHRFGSFLNCLSKKKSCSPAVKIKSPPQSTQVRRRSMKSTVILPLRSGRENRARVRMDNGVLVCRIVTRVGRRPVALSKGNSLRACRKEKTAHHVYVSMNGLFGLQGTGEQASEWLELLSPAPCGSSCGCAYVRALLLHAAFRPVSGKKSGASLP